MKPLIIGIAGGTGSGKTTLVDRLLEQFGDDISVLPHDNYIMPPTTISPWSSGKPSTMTIPPPLTQTG